MWNLLRTSDLSSFQLHTVHQEPGLSALMRLLTMQVTFNSTRYIRNPTLKLYFQTGFQTFQLHTVHQELAGSQSSLSAVQSLSTPHGTLGTRRSQERLRGENLRFQLHTVHQEQTVQRTAPHRPQGSFNSTRYIRNTLYVNPEHVMLPNFFQLHTVHQELAFEKIVDNADGYLSTPHGTLGTKRLRGSI